MNLTSHHTKAYQATRTLYTELRKAGVRCYLRKDGIYLPLCKKTLTPGIDYTVAAVYSSKRGLVSHTLNLYPCVRGTHPHLHDSEALSVRQ